MNASVFSIFAGFRSASLAFFLLGGAGIWWWTADQRALREPKVVPVPEVDHLAQTRAAPTRPAVAQPPRPVAYGTLQLDVPSDVAVYWNGRRVDPTKPMPAQHTGRHQIRLEKAGMKPIVQTVTVKAGEPTVIRVR